MKLITGVLLKSCKNIIHLEVFCRNINYSWKAVTTCGTPAHAYSHFLLIVGLALLTTFKNLAFLFTGENNFHCILFLYLDALDMLI